MNAADALLATATAGTWAGLGTALAVAAIFGYTDVRLQSAGIAGLSAALDVYVLLLAGPAAAVATGLAGGVGASLSTPASPRRGLRSCVVRGLGIAVGALMIMLGNRMAPGAGQSLLWMSAVVCVCLLVQLVTFSWIRSHVEKRWEYAISRSMFERQLPMILAQVSAVLLATAVQPTMGVWALLLLVVLLLLVRQSYVLLAEVSESYLRTVEVLVRASEGTVWAGEANSEAAADLARRIAERLGLSASGVQRAGYAALLCALAGISPGAAPSQLASRIVSQVGLFDGVVGILELIEGRFSDGDVSDADLTVAWLVIRSWDYVCSKKKVESIIPESSRDAVRSAMTPEARVRVSRAMVGLGMEI